jgi:ABC-2 type transport system permease protein
MWRLGIAEAMAYRAAMLIWILTTTFPLVSLALWHSLAEAGPIGDYGSADFVAYFVAAFLIRQLTASWVVWDLAAQIGSGDLSTLLMRPVHPLLHHLMSNLAALPVRMLLAAPLGVVVLIFAGEVERRPRPAPAARAAGGDARVVAQPLRADLRRLPGVLADLVDLPVRAVARPLHGAVGLRGPDQPVPRGSGRGRPLPAVSRALGFPVELTIGRLSGPELAVGFALQLLWLAVFGGLALWLWRRGLRAYGAVGA